MRYSFLLLFGCWWAACGQNGPDVDHAGALPHVETDAPAAPADESTLAQLADAQGRRAFRGSRAAIEARLQTVNAPLVVYQYWTLDCAACITQNRALQQIAGELPPGRLEVHYLNLDAADRGAAVDAQIRAQGLTGHVYQLPRAEAERLVIREGAPIALPHLQLYDPINDVYVSYDVALPAEVLRAIVGSMGAAG